MKFDIEIAKNCEKTLKLNNRYIYSKYHPKNDVENFINQECDQDAPGYLLVGLGLGYHLECLSRYSPTKPIFVLTIDPLELKVFQEHSDYQYLLCVKNIEIIDGKFSTHTPENYQLIIPSAWIMAMDKKHPLYNQLQDLKIRQMSYQFYKGLMIKNFEKNLENNDQSIERFINAFNSSSACLVSAGPSLDTTVGMLKTIETKIFILCVGAALKVLLKQGIIPDAVIITDPTPKVKEQLRDTDYKGLLFYLATANHEMTLLHQGNRKILFQEGFLLSEAEAASKRAELVETGGSVATAALSLLEMMGFGKVFLFGQDFGYKEENTHSVESPSNSIGTQSSTTRKVLSNNGEHIHTNNSLNLFRRWFENKAERTPMKIFNTSLDGAKIKGVPFVTEMEIEKHISAYEATNFKERLIELSGN